MAKNAGVKETGEGLAAVSEAASRFRMPGRLLKVEPLGAGHINDTFRLTFLHRGARGRYVLQRVNRGVFPDPPAQMRNIERVLRHLKAKARDPRRALRMIPVRGGSALWRDAGGDYWRATAFVEGTRTLTVVRTPRQAYEASKAFGRFGRLLADLRGPRLKDILPHFHDTPRRLSAFRRALAADPAGRARRVRREVEFVLANEPIAGVVEGLKARGLVPERTVHGDTKIDNVLFDARTGEGLCVVDLDTVMTGVSLYDFGDMVRSAISSAPEDETDLSKVDVRMPVFEAMARGYLETAGSVLNSVERRHLSFSARLIAFELGTRFLTDYLEGDVYFKTLRPRHNLDRARNQLRLAELLARYEVEMDRVVERLGPLGGGGLSSRRRRGCGG